MRNMKLFGLCLCCALAAFAVMGAGSASATKLCSVNTSPCPAGNTYGKGTGIKAQLVSGGKSVMSSGFVTITCTSSTMNGKTTSDGGGSGVAVTGELSSVTWKNCTSGLGSCTASSLFTPWPAEVTGSGGNGTMSVSNAGGKFTCGGTTCEYKASKASVSVSGGSPAKVKASNVSFSKVGGGFLCSSTASWSSEYEVTSPSPLFVVSG